MGIESGAQYIWQLDPTLPLVGDPITEGDDHIRLIKQCIQNTFVNFTVPIDAVALEQRFVDLEARMQAVEDTLSSFAVVDGSGNLELTGTLTATSLVATGNISALSIEATNNITCTNLTATDTVTGEQNVDGGLFSSDGNVIAFTGS